MVVHCAAFSVILMLWTCLLLFAFEDSSLNPILSCFPRSFHCLWCHLGTWWGWAVSWRRWPWNIAPARTWRSSLRICSVVQHCYFFLRKYLYGYPGYLFSIHQQGTFREDGNVSSMVVWRCCHVLLCRFQEEPGWTQIHKWMLEK